jgi:flagellar biosynthesis/type III secretory pathway chaperone
MTPEMYDELLDLIDQEHRFLMAGDLQGIARLAPLKESLTAYIRTLSGPQVQEVQPLLARNQRLFQAAMNGLTMARRQLAQARQGHRNLTTYGADGRARGIGPRATVVERRA